MTGHAKVGGAWKDVDSIHCKVNGSWKDVTEGYVKVSGAWQQFYSANPTIEYLVVAGGAGGGTTNNDNGGGGGGAGGAILSTVEITPQTSYAITIGAGGPRLDDVSTVEAAVGGDSVFGSFTAKGGGGGGGWLNGNQTVGFTGMTGASSGGTSVSRLPRDVVVAGQGNKGGRGMNRYSGGGGGGAGAVGGDGVVAEQGQGGAGGIGIQTDITGVNTYYAGGGGGGGAAWPSVHPDSSSVDMGGPGGLGGGGRGRGNQSVWDSVAGTVNTGGGGGGGTGGPSGGPPLGKSGGSGVVILKYPNTYTISVGAGLTSTTSTVGSYKVTVFTAGTDTVSFS